MKKRKWTASIAIIMILLLAACGIRSKESISTEEMAVPEVSSQDLLVNSLEYLLEDGDEITAAEEETAGQEQTVEKEPSAAEQNAADMQLVIYYGNGETLSLDEETVDVEAVTPEELLAKLAGHNIVSLDTKVLSFEQADKDGESVLYLDLSQAAEEYIKTMSKEAECIIVAAIANTFLDNYDADGIYITVGGEPLATSHMQYEQMITACEPEELLKVIGD